MWRNPLRLRGERRGVGFRSLLKSCSLNVRSSGWNTSFKGERYRSSTPHPFPLEITPQSEDLTSKLIQVLCGEPRNR